MSQYYTHLHPIKNKTILTPDYTHFIDLSRSVAEHRVIDAPVLRATLSPREVAALSVLGKAIKPTTLDPQFVLCPHCQQHRAQV